MTPPKSRDRRRPFVELRPAEFRTATSGEAHLFLGRLEPEALRAELEEAGIMDSSDYRRAVDAARDAARFRSKRL